MSSSDDRVEDFQKIINDIGKICNSNRSDNIYRIIVSRKQITDKNFGFLKYVDQNKLSTENKKEKSKKIDPEISRFKAHDDMVKIGDYNFHFYKTHNKVNKNLEETFNKFKDSGEWYLTLNCFDILEDFNLFDHLKSDSNTIRQVIDKELVKKFTRNSGIAKQPVLKLKSGKSCEKLGANISITGQCILPKNLEKTNNALKQYNESSRWHINNNNNRDHLRILSLNLSNF